MRFYIIRHGQTEYNRRGIVQGRLDSPLSESGKRTALTSAAQLSKVRFDLVVTGGQGRQNETANIVLSQNESRTRPPFIQIPDLREQNYGYFDGKPVTDLFAEINKELGRQWGRDPASIDAEQMMVDHELTLVQIAVLEGQVDKTRQAETQEQLKIRALKGFDRLLEQARGYRAENVLLVSSGGILATLIYELTGDERTAYSLRHGTISMIEQTQEGYRVCFWDTEQL